MSPAGTPALQTSAVYPSELSDCQLLDARSRMSLLALGAAHRNTTGLSCDATALEGAYADLRLVRLAPARNRRGR
jgi:hypothetical protein